MSAKRDCEDLRRRNEARCERLLDRSELLQSADLDWDSVPDTPVDPGVLDCLVYMRDVEGFTTRELTGLAAHPTTLSDPIVRRFLSVWRGEEAAHADALGRFIDLYAAGTGVSLPDRQAPPPSMPPLRERVAVLMTRPVGHVIAATHMAWGATNELLTLNGYRILANNCGHPILRELLSRIAAQESRHYTFYALQVEWRLATSRMARRFVAHLMRRTWTPVGIGDGYKAPAEFDRVLSVLARDDEGARAIARMDRTIGALPGLGGIDLYRRAMDDSRVRVAERAVAVAA